MSHEVKEPTYEITGLLEQFTVTVEMGYARPPTNMVEVTAQEGATGVHTETSTSGYVSYVLIITKNH